MALKFKLGDNVAQNVAPVKGVVVEKTIVGDDVLYRVDYKVGDESHSRWFAEEEIEIAQE